MLRVQLINSLKTRVELTKSTFVYACSKTGKRIMYSSNDLFLKKDERRGEVFVSTLRDACI